MKLRADVFFVFFFFLVQKDDDRWASLKEKAFPRLTSRDPKTFWTSGQWMTERGGGSDVGKPNLTREGTQVWFW